MIISAPVATEPPPSTVSQPPEQDEMPEHIATPRGKKVTDGPLTGRGQPKKISKKRKSATSKAANAREDGALDMPNLTASTTSRKRGSVAKAEPDQESPQKRAKQDKLLPYIVGIDLGMWGFGKWYIVSCCCSC